MKIYLDSFLCKLHFSLGGKKKVCVILDIYRNTDLNLDPESIAYKHGHISYAFIAGRPKGDAHTSM